MSLKFAQENKTKKLPNPLTEPEKWSDLFANPGGGESKTKQADAESCDINLMMKRYEQTGLLPERIQREPQYGEFADMATFHEAQNIVAHANSQFALLPAETRAFFKNDPAQFLDYIDQAPKSKEKTDKLVELGLMELVKPQKEDPNLTALKTIAENTKRNKASAASKAKDDPE